MLYSGIRGDNNLPLSIKGVSKHSSLHYFENVTQNVDETSRRMSYIYIYPGEIYTVHLLSTQNVDLHTHEYIYIYIYIYVNKTQIYSVIVTL